MAKKTSEAVSVAARSPDLWVLGIQVLVSFFLVSKVTASEAYQAYHSVFQVPAYLLVFNLSLLLLQHLWRPFLSRRMLPFMLALLGLAVIYIYAISFDPTLGLDGDGAEYLIRAKSLLMGKGFRNLRLPGEPFDASLKAIGFSLIHVPLMALAGSRSFALFKLIELLSTCLGLWFLYRYFEDKLPSHLRFLLVAMTAFHSQIIHFASVIMTEAVSFALLWWILYSTERWVPRQPVTEKRGLEQLWGPTVLAVSSFFLFTVREAMIGVPAVVAAVMLLRRQRWMPLMVFVVLLAVLMGGLFTYSRHLGSLNQKAASAQLAVAQPTETVKNRSVVTVFKEVLDNLRLLEPGAFPKAFLVISQKLAGDPDRPDYRQGGVLLNVLILVVMLAGVLFRWLGDGIQGVYPHDLFLLIFIPTVVFFWPANIDVVVYSRYFYPLIPIAIAYFLEGLQRISDRLIRHPVWGLRIVVAASVLPLVFFFVMNTRAVYAARYPYPPAVKTFIAACEWIRNNTPRDTLIATRKSSLAFLWAERKSIHYFDDNRYSRYSRYSAEFEQDTLEYYRRWGVRYVVLDAFSADAFNKILPIVRNRPEVFRVVHVTSSPQSYILEVVGERDKTR